MWRKSWWECRFRVYLCLVLGLFLVLNGLFVIVGAVKPADAWAGSGINSQSMWGLFHGFHPSMFFLLSLPMSRRRALLTRSAVGAIFGFLIVALAALSFGLLARLRGAPVGMKDILSAGLVTPDAIGTNFAALSGGYSFVAGKIGNAIHFNGATGGALTARAPFDPTQSFSIAAWVYPTQTTSFQGLVCQPAATASNFFLEIGVSSNGRLLFDFDLLPQASTTARDAIATSVTVPAAGVWYHLAGVYDAVKRQVLLYVNGVLEGSAPANGSFANTGGLAFGYSKWLGGRVEGSTARIDDVRAYNVALTPAQVQLLFQGK